MSTELSEGRSFRLGCVSVHAGYSGYIAFKYWLRSV